MTAAHSETSEFSHNLASPLPYDSFASVNASQQAESIFISPLLKLKSLKLSHKLRDSNHS